MFWVLLLLSAWAAAGTACTRLCLAAARAAAVGADAVADAREHELTLYEAAFLSGGRSRVADVAMVAMARQRRLLLAHTGWVTVVDPDGRDDVERSVIGAVGPEGQSRVAPVRAAVAASDGVGRIADRLVRAGLAEPDGGRGSVAAGVHRVRLAAAAVSVLCVTAMLTPVQEGMPRHLVALWFALPLTLTLSCLVIARLEVHPCSRWASPTGQRLLCALARRATGADDRTFLTSVAVRGVRAVGEPELRAAFAHRDQPGRG